MWIEILSVSILKSQAAVTPCAGVWIEITGLIDPDIRVVSLPVRECGLKSAQPSVDNTSADVTPCAGVWIEILLMVHNPWTYMSLPVRECGLKYSGRF